VCCRRQTFNAVKNLIYVTTGNNYSDPPTDTSDAFLAFRVGSGELVWSRQLTAGDAFNLACGSPRLTNCPEAKGQDHDFGSSPILLGLRNGKRTLIGAQKSGVVTAIDPDRQGELLWHKRIGRGGAPPGSREWAVNPVVSFLLHHETGGGLYALKLETGAEVWHTPPGCGEVPGCSPAQSAAVMAIPGLVFSGGLDGHIRAYSTRDGRIVWDVNTMGEYRTVNGVTGRGGSIDGPGPVSLAEWSTSTRAMALQAACLETSC
jgi:polyvinyl alcohol dehydrogenase (cytochrome)